MKIYRFFLGLAVIAAVFVSKDVTTAMAATKEIETEIAEDYASAKFTVAFDEKGEYDIVLTSPNKQTYTVPSEDGKVYEYTVQDFAKGKWKITISNAGSDSEGEGGSLEETEGESDTSGGTIGHAKITVNGSRQALMDTSNENIMVAEEITGYRAYFKNDILHVQWEDASVGNVQVTVTDQKTQEMIDSKTVQEMSYDVQIDPALHPYVIVTIVPSVSAGKSGAEKSYTYTTLNDPAAAVEFENVDITNKESIKAYVTLDKRYGVMTESVENGPIKDLGVLEPGQYETDLPLEMVGENAFNVWITDPDNGYMKSWSYSVEKDVTAPVLKLASSYENIVTEAEFYVFEGSIDDTYDTFTINGTDIKVEGDHTFRYEYSLKEGENNITITATDKAGNISEFNTVITRVIPEPDKTPWELIYIGVGVFAVFILLFVKLKILKKNDGNEEEEKKSVPKKEKEEKEPVSLPKRIFEVVDILIPVIFVIVMMRFVLLVTTVESGSMEPKLVTGTTAVFNRLAYMKHDVQRGDIVCLWSDEFNEYESKRVIGIGGDEIRFRDGDVYINGLKCDESAYIDGEVETNCNDVFDVPEGCVFVMGDNREYSYDSRFFGQPYIAETSIKGKYIGSIPFSIYNLERKINPEMGRRGN